MSLARILNLQKCLCMLYFLIWLFAHIVVESFPLSSSGHVRLVQKIGDFFCFDYHYADLSAACMSDILQGVSVLVILVFFRSLWIPTLFQLRQHWCAVRSLFIFTVIADVITTCFFIFFKITGIGSLFPLWVGFCITAFVLLAVSFVRPVAHVRSLTSQLAVRSVLIGCAQAIALLAGISRLACTYSMGRLMGMSHAQAFGISFLIELPLISGVFFLTLSGMIADGSVQHLLHPVFLLGTLSAGLLALYALKLTDYIMYKQNGWIFSVYLIVPIVVCIWFTC